MSLLENEYTFVNVRLNRVDIIKKLLDAKYGKATQYTYSKVSFRDEDDNNVQYRLYILDGKKFYQIKTKIGHSMLSPENDTGISITVSSEEKLLVSKFKQRLNKLNKLDTSVMTRFDWMNGSISMRYDTRVAYVEMEVSEFERDIDYPRFVFIYEVVYDKLYIKSAIQVKGNSIHEHIRKLVRNPIPIQKDRRFVINLFKEPFVVRAKTDGIHGFVINVGKKTYVWFSNNNPVEIKHIPMSDILEVEFIDKKHIVFIDNMSSKYDNFVDRYRHSKKLLVSVKHIIFRPYRLFTESKANLLANFESFKKMASYRMFKSDGLIIQSIYKYTSPGAFLYKFKVGSENTIDMILDEDGFKVSANKHGDLVEFTGSHDHPFVYEESDYTDSVFDIVSEWKYDTDINKFVFMRERDDKIYPNILSTATSNWDSIFMDMDELFGSNTAKRVKFVISVVKGRVINKGDVSAYMPLGAGSAGVMNRYPEDKFVFMSDISADNAKEAISRITKANKTNIIFKILDYLDMEKVKRYWNMYMETCDSVQITNFITITHQSIAQIPQLHQLWKYLLSRDNVKNITMMILDGKHVLDMKKNNTLRDVGISIEHIKDDYYRTKIGKTTTADFTEYLYDSNEYFKNIDKLGIAYEMKMVEEYIDFPIDYLNNSELSWLRCHYVVILTKYEVDVDL